MFFLKEKLAFRVAADRAIALNPMDVGPASAYLGLLMAAAGDWGLWLCCLRCSHAVENPNHPGWFHLAAFANAYFKGDYRGALDAALRVNTPATSMPMERVLRPWVSSASWKRHGQQPRTYWLCVPTSPPLRVKSSPSGMTRRALS